MVGVGLPMLPPILYAVSLLRPMAARGVLLAFEAFTPLMKLGAFAFWMNIAVYAVADNSTFNLIVAMTFPLVTPYMPRPMGGPLPIASVVGLAALGGRVGKGVSHRQDDPGQGLI